MGASYVETWHRHEVCRVICGAENLAVTGRRLLHRGRGSDACVRAFLQGSINFTYHHPILPSCLFHVLYPICLTHAQPWPKCLRSLSKHPFETVSSLVHHRSENSRAVSLILIILDTSIALALYFQQSTHCLLRTP